MPSKKPLIPQDDLDNSIKKADLIKKVKDIELEAEKLNLDKISQLRYILVDNAEAGENNNLKVSQGFLEEDDKNEIVEKMMELIRKL